MPRHMASLGLGYDRRNMPTTKDKKWPWWKRYISISSVTTCNCAVGQSHHRHESKVVSGTAWSSDLAERILRWKVKREFGIEVGEIRQQRWSS